MFRIFGFYCTLIETCSLVAIFYIMIVEGFFVIVLGNYFTFINDFIFTSHREPAQLPEYSFRVNLEQPKEIGSMFITLYY